MSPVISITKGVAGVGYRKVKTVKTQNKKRGAFKLGGEQHIFMGSIWVS